MKRKSLVKAINEINERFGYDIHCHIGEKGYEPHAPNCVRYSINLVSGKTCNFVTGYDVVRFSRYLAVRPDSTQSLGQAYHCWRNRIGEGVDNHDTYPRA